MLGPGFGHNIEPKLRGLSQCKDFEISFWADSLNATFKEKYTYIHYIEPQILLRKKRPFRSLITLIKALLILWKGDYDVIYSVGMGGFLTAFIYFFSKKKTIKVFEIFSNHFIWNARRNKTIKERLDNYIIRKADYFCQYWWGIREDFVNSFPKYENKFLMYDLAYPNIFFSNEKHCPTSNYVKEFLNKIPNNQIVCFWPRSFIPSNNHKLLLDSLGLIKDERPELLVNFKLYLWGGNVERSYSRNAITEAIKANSLNANVEIVDHPFVPQNDIFAIEERSNFFVQIANDDILSSYIMEMICSGKPFILSNLRTFQFLNEKYDLNIELVENDARAIADRIIEILCGLNPSELKVFESRKAKCAKLFAPSSVKPWYITLYNKLYVSGKEQC